MHVSFAESLTALVSKYLDCVLAAQQEEVEQFFSRIIGRARVREGIHALQAARELTLRARRRPRDAAGFIAATAAVSGSEWRIQARAALRAASARARQASGAAPAAPVNTPAKSSPSTQDTGKE